MKLSDFFPDMEGFTPIGEGVAKTPQFPNPETQVSPFLRTTLPLPLQYSGDTVKQYNRPGMSSFRIAPLPPGGIPTINATAQGVTNVVNNITNGGTGILLETDGVANAKQDVLDLIPGTNITMASDPNGGVTISGAATTGLFMSRPDYKRWALWSQTGSGGGIGGGFLGIDDTLTNTVSGTNSNALVAASATDDYGVKITATTATTGYNAITGVQNMIPARAFSLFMSLRIATNSGNMRVWAIASNPNNAGDITAIMTSNTPNRDIVGFRYSSGVSANWFAVQAQLGGGITTVDTGVAATTNSVMLRVDYDPSTTTSTYYINGAQVATISTTPPTLTFTLGGMIGVGGSTGSLNGLNIFSYYSEMRTTVTTN